MLRSFQIGSEVRNHGIDANEISVSEIKQSDEKCVWLVQLDGTSRHIVKQYGAQEHDYMHFATELSALQHVAPRKVVPVVNFYDHSTRIICTEFMGAHIDISEVTGSRVTDIHLNYEIDRSNFVPHQGLPGALSWFDSRPTGLNYLQQAIVDRIINSRDINSCAQHVLAEWSDGTLIHGDMKFPHVFKSCEAFRFCDWEFAQFGRIEWDIAGLVQTDILQAVEKREQLRMTEEFFSTFCKLDGTSSHLVQHMTVLRLAQSAVEMLSGFDSISRRSVEILIVAELLAKQSLRSI